MSLSAKQLRLADTKITIACETRHATFRAFSNRRARHLLKPKGGGGGLF